MESPFRIWREALAKHKPRKISGAYWYRAVIRTRRNSLLTMDGALLYGGRYNAPGKFGALYLSESPEGCAAERARRPATPQDYIVGTVRVTLENICDLTDQDLLAELGITSNQLKADDLNETQILGTLIRDAGFEGMLVPSAAGAFNNLAIFMDRLSDSSEVDLEDVQPLS